MKPETVFSLIIALTFVVIALRDVRTNFWPKFSADKSFQHLTFFVIFALFLLWSARASVKQDLHIHFLALTTLTMMYGWRCAYFLTIPVIGALMTVGSLSAADALHTLMISALLPILISYTVFALSYHYLPRNIFVFIFVAGFFNGGLTALLHLLFNSLYQYTFSRYDWATIVDNYLMLAPLIAFPEGLLNGMALAILSVFKPEWLRVFSDRDYIYNHYHNK